MAFMTCCFSVRHEDRFSFKTLWKSHCIQCSELKLEVSVNDIGMFNMSLHKQY